MLPFERFLRGASTPLHLFDSFRSAAESHPTAMIHFDVPLNAFPDLGIHATYREAVEAVSHRGEQLICQGITPGDQVVVHMAASFDSYLLMVSIAYAGAIPVMVSPQLAVRTMTLLAVQLNKPWLLFDDSTAKQAGAISTVACHRKLHIDRVTDLRVDGFVGPATPMPHDAVSYMTHTAGATGPALVAHTAAAMGRRAARQRSLLGLVDRRGLAAFHLSPVHCRFHAGLAALMSLGFSLLSIADPSLKNIEQVMLRYRPSLLQTYPKHFVRWAPLLDRDPSIFRSVRYLYSAFDAVGSGTIRKYLAASGHRMPVFLQVGSAGAHGRRMLRPYTRMTMRVTGRR